MSEDQMKRWMAIVSHWHDGEIVKTVVFFDRFAELDAEIDKHDAAMIEDWRAAGQYIIEDGDEEGEEPIGIAIYPANSELAALPLLDQMAFD